MTSTDRAVTKRIEILKILLHLQSKFNEQDMFKRLNNWEQKCERKACVNFTGQVYAQIEAALKKVAWFSDDPGHSRPTAHSLPDGEVAASDLNHLKIRLRNRGEQINKYILVKGSTMHKVNVWILLA